MIIGQGIDIMKTERISRVIARYGERFLKKVYTEYERRFCQTRKGNAVQVYTAYWATKEAAMKALGTGNRKGVRFCDIEIRHHLSGKPYLILYGKSKLISENLGVNNISISMSHLDDLVVASVIMEKLH